MKTKVSIRPAEPHDIAIVLELIKELASYEKEAEQVLITEQELRRDGFEEKAFEILLAEMSNKVVGMAFFYPRYSTWKGKTVYLEDLIVREEYRRKGVGSALFDEVLRLSKERQVSRMEWQVLDWNESAIAFYEKKKAIMSSEWLNGKLEFR